MGRSVHTPAYKALLETLIAAREEAGLTQVELAARLGTTQSFISKCERGERRIDVVEFVEFVTAMGAEPDAVFGAFMRLRNAT
jgi:transcriptional regulator with XRE-family HTH domain